MKVAQIQVRQEQRIRALEKRAPGGISKETGKSIGSDYTPVGRETVAEEIAKAHTGLMDDLAVEADAFITATGGIVWQRWQGTGYRNEFPSPKTGPIDFVTEAIRFYGEFRSQVADLYDKLDDVREENERLRGIINALTNQERGKQQFLDTFLILKLKGVFLSSEEISSLSELIRVSFYGSARCEWLYDTCRLSTL